MDSCFQNFSFHSEKEKVFFLSIVYIIPVSHTCRDNNHDDLNAKAVHIDLYHKPDLVASWQILHDLVIHCLWCCRRRLGKRGIITTCIPLYISFHAMIVPETKKCQAFTNLPNHGSNHEYSHHKVHANCFTKQFRLFCMTTLTLWA